MLSSGEIRVQSLRWLNVREYSVYSGSEDRYLEVLIREIPNGRVSQQLRGLQSGATLQIDGPFGYFQIPDQGHNHQCVLVASGTGIAPYHSFIRSYPDIDYLILHGIRFDSERYEKDDYDPARYIPCFSRPSQTAEGFAGRVTEFLRHGAIDIAALYYLCGNCDMIYDVYKILKDCGVSSDHIFAEVYF